MASELQLCTFGAESTYNDLFPWDAAVTTADVLVFRWQQGPLIGIQFTCRAFHIPKAERWVASTPPGRLRDMKFTRARPLRIALFEDPEHKSLAQIAERLAQRYRLSPWLSLLLQNEPLTYLVFLGTQQKNDFAELVGINPEYIDKTEVYLGIQNPPRELVAQIERAYAVMLFGIRKLKSLLYTIGTGPGRSQPASTTECIPDKLYLLRDGDLFLWHIIVGNYILELRPYGSTREHDNEFLRRLHTGETRFAWWAGSVPMHTKTMQCTCRVFHCGKKESGHWQRGELADADAVDALMSTASSFVDRCC